MAFGYPANGLDISQATGAGFDIGLQVVLGVGKFAMPRDLLVPFGAIEFAAIPHFPGPGGFAQGLVLACITAQQSRLHQVGGNRDVVVCRLHALLDSPDAVADIQLDIP